MSIDQARSCCRGDKGDKSNYCDEPRAKRPHRQNPAIYLAGGFCRYNIAKGRSVYYKLDARMRTLSVQFQPQRSPRLSTARVLALFAKSVAAEPIVRSFEVQQGQDKGPYVNLHFATQNRSLADVWALIKRRVLADRAVGPALRRSCIVTCEGSRGWDNYLLLHHFDPKVSLDVL